MVIDGIRALAHPAQHPSLAQHVPVRSDVQRRDLLSRKNAVAQDAEPLAAKKT